ncbi:ACP S-malonyltransferase [Zhenhengia yiwuensis]|uniref:[acyl-carrier-protein] S-malonyltransferase n=1 Tax=Zhenhengia yiwuensis TaxID=2763666 RepID=A0A926EI21_9FIRM|nr:acyltransferase domain-containing protein [Zhenhengia yiwuensis]MBC8580759.1 acyltransferase domain-containing protein [Zhenhengia yiwuensis]
MKTAIGFNGQGIQNKKVYLELKEKYKETEVIIQRANQILSFDLAYVLQHEKLINAVEYTQVVVYVINYIMYQYMIEQMNIHPSIVLGHSLGHYNALTCAGVFSFEDTLKIVERRAYLTSQCVKGRSCGLFAIKGKQIDIEWIKNKCKQLSYGEKVVEVAIINSSEEVVLAYYDYFFEELVECFNEYFLIKLNVSAPYHSSALNKIAAEFYKFLSEFPVNQPKIAVVSNCTGSLLEKETIKSDLVLHLTSTINMQRCIQYIRNYDVLDLVEVSFERVISKIAKTMKNINTYTIGLEEAQQNFHNALAEGQSNNMLTCFLELYGNLLSMPEREKYIPTSQLEEYYAILKNVYKDGKVDYQCFAEFRNRYHDIATRSEGQLTDDQTLLLQYHLRMFE